MDAYCKCPYSENNHAVYLIKYKNGYYGSIDFIVVYTCFWLFWSICVYFNDFSSVFFSFSEDCFTQGNYYKYFKRSTKILDYDFCFNQIGSN